MATDSIDPNQSPTALFCALETALSRGDFNRAAELREKLARLGYDVRLHIPPKLKPATPPPAAKKVEGRP